MGGHGPEVTKRDYPIAAVAAAGESAAGAPAGPYHSAMNAELFSATILLILVIDPFGNVPLVVAALKNVAPRAPRARGAARVRRGVS